MAFPAYHLARVSQSFKPVWSLLDYAVAAAAASHWRDSAGLGCRRPPVPSNAALGAMCKWKPEVGDGKCSQLTSTALLIRLSSRGMLSTSAMELTCVRKQNC